MRLCRARLGAGHVVTLAFLFLALLPLSAAAQQTAVLRLGTPSLSSPAGQNVTLAMRFNAVPMAEDYRVFVHFVGTNGSNYSVPNADHMPPVGTSSWNGTVSYNHTVTLPSGMPQGTYSIRVGLYQNHSPWNRVALAMGTGVTVDDQLRYTVGTLTVGSQPSTTTVLQLGTPNLSAQAGQNVTLAMRFNAVPMAQDYYVFVHFVDQNGVQHSTLNADHLPPVGTSQWSGAIAYNVNKTLPSNLASGQYTIRVGLYSMAAPDTRIALTAGSGVTVDNELRYTVGTLTVGSPPSTTTVLQLGTPSLSAQAGQNVTLAMRFNAVPMAQDYYVFVHFVDQNGVQHSTLNADHLPPVGTSQWSGAVAYNVTKTLPSNLASGQYTIRVGLYSMAAPDNRIALTAGSGVTVDNQLRYTVGTLTVSGGTTAPSGGPLGQDPNAYVLTFSDEFDNGFNTSKWNDHIWYQSPDPVINYKVSNGSLKIWPAAGFVNRTIDTDGKFSQTYGYFEMEARLPIGKGVWPAFWLYAHPGNDRPEIDIMEAYPGGGPNSGWGDSNLHPVNYGLTLHKANADYSYHEVPYSTTLRQFSPYGNGVDLSAAFHTYAVKWEPSGVTFYFDGQQLGPKYWDTANYYNRPMYILLDLWFGSASGAPDGTTPTGEGNSFEVKYVRAWQFK